jgi:hypothetical protein
MLVILTTASWHETIEKNLSKSKSKYIDIDTHIVKSHGISKRETLVYATQKRAN